MRTVGRRSIVLYLLSILFVAGLCWFLAQYVLHGEWWATQPYNKHLSAAAMGEIKDRNEVLLARSVDGQRQYSESETVRRALLHTVGDTEGFISTSVQAGMRAKLNGYNLITGLSDTPLNRLSSSVKLTIDAELSAAAYSALGEKNGAVIIYNYDNGDIVCKVSKPGYDPANPPEGLSSDPQFDGVFLDRNLSTAFTPGSIMKVITQAAAMEKWPNQWQDKAYTCEGEVEVGGSAVTCMGVHGNLTATAAFGNSCNVYYALLANEIGAPALQKKAEQYGVNRQLYFGEVPCAQSKMDLSAVTSNQLAWAGIGQHTSLANPYHMLTLMGAVANGGTYQEPRMVGGLDVLGMFSSGERKYMDHREATQIKTLMRGNVRDYYGDFFPKAMEVCAKTGTGEVGEEKGPNCWIIGFCANKQYPYAFVVMVEDGVSGAASAGPIANALMEMLV